MADTVWTYIRDADDPLKNIRIATDAAGYDDKANRQAIARYTGLSELHISGELNGRIYALPDHRVVAHVVRVSMPLKYIEDFA